MSDTKTEPATGADTKASGPRKRCESPGAPVVKKTEGKTEASIVKEVVKWWECFFDQTRCEKVEDWNRIPFGTRVLIMTRVCVLHITYPTAIVPVAIAYSRGTLLPWAGTFWFLSFVLFHMSHNMLNDATDLALGRDTKKSFRLTYGVHPLAQGFVSTEFWALLAATTLGALACAAVLHKTWPAWLFAGVVACSVLYTWPLKGYGIGEMCVFCVWGPIAVIGGYQAVSGIYDPELLWISVPFGLAASGILFGKHIDKMEESREKGVYTMPVLLGDAPARYMTVVVVFAMYAAILALVFRGSLAYHAAGAMLVPAWWTMPLFLKAFLSPRPTSVPEIIAPVPVPFLGLVLDTKKLWPMWYVCSAFFQVNMVLLCLAVSIVVQACGAGPTL